MFAAAEVRTAGWGGLAVVAGITGLARSTINRGEDDLDAEPLEKGQVRRTGGGRKAVSENDPELVPELKRLVEPATLGDPMRPLIWVSKSMDKLAETLTAMGHPIGADTVRKELVNILITSSSGIMPIMDFMTMSADSTAVAAKPASIPCLNSALPFLLAWCSSPPERLSAKRGSPYA